MFLSLAPKKSTPHCAPALTQNEFNSFALINSVSKSLIKRRGKIK